MAEALRFLFTDAFHINARNFASLFAFTTQHAIPTTVHERHAELKAALGRYQGRSEVARYLPTLRAQSVEQLSTCTHSYGTTPLVLFPLCRAELLSYVLAQSNALHEQPFTAGDDDALLSHLYREHRELLLSNLAAAMFWIDELAPYFAGRNSGFTHAFVFNGSMIYTRVVMELCKRSETHCMVLESSFTGHQYHLEERYEPLGSGPDIQQPTVRAARWSKVHADQRSELRTRATHMMFGAKNKNVVQPSAQLSLTFAEPERPELLIVGQVVNDFSLVEKRVGTVSSVRLYKELLCECLAHTDYNIIFKAHPWERRKQLVERPFTLDQLQAFRASLPESQQRRVVLTEEANMLALGKRVDRVVLLGSQAGLELAFHCGLRPSTLAHPYYERGGFTDDFDDVQGLIDHVRAHGHEALLDLDAYDALLEFLACFLTLDCVTDDASDVAGVARKLPRTEDRIQPLRSGNEPSFGRLTAKARKLIRDPRRFVRDSRALRKLWNKG